MFQLSLRHTLPWPTEIPSLLPESIRELDHDGLARLHIRVGNRMSQLGEFFDIHHLQSPTNLETLVLSGDLSQLHHLGQGMATGQIIVEGNIGRHVGARMDGGTITVRGSTGDWAGAEMRSGSLIVAGNVGDHSGSAYPGARRGMTGGQILIHGNAGRECGHRMRRGSLIVKGSVGPFAGHAMIAGTIVAWSGFGPHFGLDLKRGTLITSQRPEPMTDRFPFCCVYEPAWLGILQKQLKICGLEIISRRVELYRGDITTNARGEFWLINTH